MKSSDRNKEPIAKILQLYLSGKGRLLEIGSGDGTHALHIAPLHLDTQWVTSEKQEQLELLQDILKAAQQKNVHGPEKLEIGSDDFPKGQFDYVFTANTLHIMSWKEVKTLIKLLGKRLREGSLVFFYGPFNYGGTFTAESNREFDQWLKSQAPHRGIRNFEDILAQMEKVGFKLLQDHEMPVNNHLLVFERLPFSKR